MRYRLIVMLAVMALLVPLLAAPGHGAPVVTCRDTEVEISGLTPGAGAAWLSVARESLAYWRTSVVRRDGVEPDGDGDGVVTIPLEKGLPPASVWIAVDLKTGDAGVGAPEGFKPRLIAEDVADLGRGASGLADLASEAHEVLELLLVRPGVGAWGLTVGDGGASDGDGDRNGAIRVALAALRPVRLAPATPPALHPGDTVVVVDTQTLQFAVQRFLAGRP